ncbi:Glycosyltransferase [Hexamita inflata]|uniref:protein xylosyltransferase n=1 Tax=Hexamita inflata TaxID=28002 RepID=A0AA86VF27_9EUKA|nr:Glycosyltransferase [Hexamita inflata]
MIVFVSLLSKHAFLIIAYNQNTLLQTLINQIDHPNSDIYIHYDAKFELPNINTIYSSLYFTDRIAVTWGTFSLVEAELILFKTALTKHKYEYYHLLSGQDLLIQPINKIFEYFNKSLNKQFLDFYLNDKWFNDLGFKSKKTLYELKTQYGVIHHGSEWCSLTNEAVQIIVDEIDQIKQNFRTIHTADEIYKQTVLFQHKNLEFNQFGGDGGHKRYIDWSKGGPNPKTFTGNDLQQIINSGMFFARKFSEQNMNVVNYIVQLTTKKDEL